ncbi:MAG: cyclic nucleotide-binding domain-containing protein [Melioribacteraceae bacterium]|nr:MAG: cyclic nucleotide-binding domain-containing protein [Melioribacteraceae bacterium]
MNFFKKNDIVVNEGSEDNLIYILTKGKIGIFKGDVKIAEFSEKGTVVGEMSTILKTPRTATIKALEDTYLITIDADLDTLILKYPDISKKILQSLAKRLKNTTNDLWKLAEKVEMAKNN